MFSSDYTCCVCKERGKALLIHHIDDNPSNNAFGNLCALCPDCHHDAQLKNGFRLTLTPAELIQHRDTWFNHLELRRYLANQLALTREVKPDSLTEQIQDNNNKVNQVGELQLPVVDYINALPAYKQALLTQAKPNWDSGDTGLMVQQNEDYIDLLKGILVTLARYSPAKQFAHQKPNEFFSEFISSRFKWHKIMLEPNGPGTGAPVTNIVCGGSVMADIEIMIENMVVGLLGHDTLFDIKTWSRRWIGEVPS